MTQLIVPGQDLALPGEEDLPLLTDEQLEWLTDEELGRYLELIGIAQTESGGWKLQPRQQTAEDRCDELMAAGETFELLYGGAAAGGKSEWLLWHLYHQALRFPGYSGLLIRRTYTELERTAILRSRARFSREHATYQVAHKRWVFNNGSIIEFGYCEADTDVYQYDSAEYDCVAWDELTQFPTDVPYRYLFSRLRTSTAKAVRGLTPHVIGGTNPHRTGVAWVKPRFVEIGKWEEPHRIVEVLDDGQERVVVRVFVPAKMTDNRYVNMNAYRSALSMLDTATRQAMEDGSWDAIEGQYFDEWNRAIHVVKAFTPPTWWTKIGGLDYGIHAPFCHLWIAFDNDGAAWVYREAYKKNLVPSEQAGLILKSEAAGERVDARFADPSVWVRTGAGPPIAQQYADAGMPVRRANNARIDGWARVRSYLRPLTPVEDPVTHEKRMQPGLFIMDNCIDLIRTLPLLVHDRKNPEDVDTEGEDHAPDALRYGLMSRPRRSMRVEDEIPRSRDLVPRRKKSSGDLFEHPTLGTLRK